eukprot:10174853-Ditylum_brightwellii.AAC.1
MCNKYPWKLLLLDQVHAVVDPAPATGKGLEFHHLIQDQDKEIWSISMANELGMLVQGASNRINGTDTIFSIRHDQ